MGTLALGSEPVGLIAGASRERRRDRFLPRAIVLSLAFHLVVAGLWIAVAPRLAGLRAVPIPQPTEQIVAISSAVRIEHRAVPQPQRAARMPAPRPMSKQVPRPVTKPAPKLVPKPVRVPQRTEKPQRVRPELAAARPAVTPAPQEGPRERASPRPVRPPATPLPRRVTQPATAGAEASERSALSPAKLAQLNQDFERTIAQSRAASNPLNVKNALPAATKRYHTQMVGIDGRLTGFQGLCDPIKSWESAGWDYYYVACNVAFDDGRTERQGVPWPVRFRPEADPFVGTGGANVPLSPPLPGWRPGPNDIIAPELRRYFHERGVEL